MLKKFTISTNARMQMIPIDREIENAVRESGVQEGICVILVPHTTAGVTVNENADPSVIRDILYATGKVFPPNDRFHHVEGNSDAHIKSSLFGPSLSLIISKNRLVLGTWQSIFFCEFDGPRERSCYIKILEG